MVALGVRGAVLRCILCWCVLVAALARVDGRRRHHHVFTSLSSCFNSQTGYETSDPRRFSYVMVPQRSTFHIQIPKYKGCTKVGVRVSVCEETGASVDLRLEQLSRLFVRRRGDLRTPGKADIIVYCR